MSDGSRSLFAPIIVIIIPAILGYIWNSLDSARKDALAYTSLQIEQLYGPIYGLTQASDRVWKIYDKKHTTPEQKDSWRNWIKTVFQPINIKIENSILNNSQLIVGNEMPDVFLTMIANAENYNALIAQWDLGKLDIEVPLVPYPDQEKTSIIVCVKESYLALKRRQEELRHWWTRPSWLPSVASEIAKVPDCHAP